jgi:hypothetical protein
LPRGAIINSIAIPDQQSHSGSTPNSRLSIELPAQRIIRTNAATVAVISMALIAGPVATLAADNRAFAPQIKPTRPAGKVERFAIAGAPGIHQSEAVSVWRAAAV